MKIIKNNGISYKLGFDNETQNYWFDWATSRGVAKGQFSGTFEAVDFLNIEVGTQFFKDLNKKINKKSRATSRIKNYIWDTLENVDKKTMYEKVRALTDLYYKKEKEITNNLAQLYLKNGLIKNKNKKGMNKNAIY